MYIGVSLGAALHQSSDYTCTYKHVHATFPLLCSAHEVVYIWSGTLVWASGCQLVHACVDAARQVAATNCPLEIIMRTNM